MERRAWDGLKILRKQLITRYITRPVSVCLIYSNKQQAERKDNEMERAEEFLKEAETYYLATLESDQPRVRLFGTAHIFEGKFYIQTGKVKDVSKQIHTNPKVEICAFKNSEWLRVAGELVEYDRREASQSMLDAYPSLQKMYAEDDGNTEVFYFKNATATFSSFHLKRKDIDYINEKGMDTIRQHAKELLPREKHRITMK